MVRTVIQDSLHAHDRISRQRSLDHRFLHTFLDSREIILRNRTAHDFLLKHIRLLQIARRLEAHLDMTILPMSAGLLFVFVFHIRFLLDRLAERDLGIAQLDHTFVLIRQTALNDLELLVADAVQQGLPVLHIIDHL